MVGITRSKVTLNAFLYYGCLAWNCRTELALQGAESAKENRRPEGEGTVLRSWCI